ncbi:MAG: DUF1345 domain-containing protein [Actinomycetota bacterium]|nr:DUF1345 domain-containing protein [Actinomycetota bacterium]
MAGCGIAAPADPSTTETWPSASRRLTTSLVVGLVVGGVVAFLAPWQISVLVAWCGIAGTFVGVAWATMLKAGSGRTRAIATREDESRVTADLVVLAASVASLIGVAFILIKASSAQGAAVAAMTGLGVVSVVLAWVMVHTVFTLRYAHLYYSGGGGIDFNEKDDPDYRDFAYLAFTIGMTYQVSDTDLQTKVIRRTALRQGLLSYLFGTAIIAMTINIVAGLAH